MGASAPRAAPAAAVQAAAGGAGRDSPPRANEVKMPSRATASTGKREARVTMPNPAARGSGEPDQPEQAEASGADARQACQAHSLQLGLAHSPSSACPAPAATLCSSAAVASRFLRCERITPMPSANRICRDTWTAAARWGSGGAAVRERVASAAAALFGQPQRLPAPPRCALPAAPHGTCRHCHRPGGHAAAVPGHAQNRGQVRVACMRVWGSGIGDRIARPGPGPTSPPLPHAPFSAVKPARNLRPAAALHSYPIACSTRRRWWAPT